jgi:glycosyltransferase involved in cell wall biosynthesis
MAFTGGAQFQIACLLDALIPLQRYEIYYIARRVPTDFQPDGYQVVGLGGNRAVRWLGHLADAPALYRALRHIRPDVIYQRVACGYTGIAAHYARRHGARLIWHVSSDTDVIPERLRGGSNFIRRFLEKRCIEFGIRRAHHVVAQSQSQARLLERNYGRIADTVIQNFHPGPCEKIDKTAPVSVIWVANLKPLKQPEAFVRLAERLRDLVGVRFTMVGAPPAREGQAWYEGLMRSMRTAPNLEYLGQRTHGEVNELLARAHIFVNTSLHEGLPNTFIQAWMREVPVVSLHIDPDGVLGREAVGILAHTEERLAQAVRMLVTEPEKRAEYAARAREYAILRHSMQNAALLTQLIDSAGIRPSGEPSLENAEPRQAGQ